MCECADGVADIIRGIGIGDPSSNSGLACWGKILCSSCLFFLHVESAPHDWKKAGAT